MAKTIKLEEKELSFDSDGGRRAIELALGASQTELGAGVKVTLYGAQFTAAEVAEAVNRLPPDHKMVVEAAFLRGFTRGEVAKAFGKSEPTMRKIINAAVDELILKVLEP